jgi:large conductance mechanosensitive channel
MRGNVIDLSVGIVIGAAFSGLVTAFTKSFIEPLIRVFSGGKELSGVAHIGDVPFDWASAVNALITFVMTAAVLYFLVVTPMNRLAERRRKGIEPAPKAPAEDVMLLREIRDLLVVQNGGTPRRDDDADDDAEADESAATIAAAAKPAPAARTAPAAATPSTVTPSTVTPSTVTPSTAAPTGGGADKGQPPTKGQPVRRPGQPRRPSR